MRILIITFFLCSSLIGCSSVTTLNKERKPSSLSSIKNTCTEIFAGFFGSKNLSVINSVPPESTPPVSGAIASYVRSSAINKKLRASTPLSKNESNFVKQLISELTSQPIFKGKVTRVTKFDFDFKSIYVPGTIVQEKAFTSASKGDGAQLMGDVIFYDLVFIINSKSARDISKLNKIEGEVIFLPNTNFKVEKAVGNFKFNETSMDQNLSTVAHYGKESLQKESIAYERGLKNLTTNAEYYKNININEIKKIIERDYQWVLDKWNLSIEDISTLEDVVSIGFDPVVEIHLIDETVL